METLTFLFTDIESSTTLLRHLGDAAYAEVLAEHHRVVRDNLKRYNGREEGTKGDGFFASFTSPSACVSAVLEIQRSIAGNDALERHHLRVRMGIHTGEASEASTGLVGYEVHRAARIASVGYGGQVLVSSATAGLVEDSLPRDITLRSLGAHRLKDLGRPEVLFQLVAEGLPYDFPPLRSLDNPELPNNLPTSLSSFIGRKVDIAEVHALVKESRLVTLTGAGGSGKTRLALQAAAELLDGSGEGVWFVELAPINDPDLVPSTVIDSLQIRQESHLPALDSLLRALREQSVLVVLDNCEHVVDEVAKMVDQIGRHCPRVRVIATSREPLGVSGEQVYRVRSLSMPPSDVEGVSDLAGSEAADLFLARTHLQDSTFVLDDANAPILASIVRRLDGIPLAIELAAVRLSSMSLGDLSRRLDQRFRLLTGGSRNALPRQQTLGAMVAWSYDLLNDPERQVLRSLSIFANGFDLDAAEAVCASQSVDSVDIADIVSSLVNKNLVNAERSAESVRYRLLETIRQYAAEQLLQVDGEARALEVRGAHAGHFLRFCERTAPELEYGPTKTSLLRTLDAEWDNIQGAFETFADDLDGVEQVLRLGHALFEYFETRKVGSAALIEEALRTGRDLPDVVRANSLFQLSLLLGSESYSSDTLDKSVQRRIALCDECLVLFERIDDVKMQSRVHASAGFLHGRHEPDRAAFHSERSMELAESLADPRTLASALMFRAVHLQVLRGDSHAEVRELLALSADLFRQVQDPVGLCRALHLRSQEQWNSLDDLRVARPLVEEAATAAEDVGDRLWLTWAWGNLGFVYFALGEIDLGDMYNRRSLILMRRMGLPLWQMVFSALTLSGCETSRTNFVRAARLAGASRSLSSREPEDSVIEWTPFELQTRDEIEATLRDRMGTESFELHFTIGQKMSDEQMVNLMLGRTDANAQ